MTTGSGPQLLRDPAGPQRATFLELFFDLVFVFALSQVAQRLVEAFAPERRALLAESGYTLLLLVALWSVWSATAWMTTAFAPQRLAIQILVAGTMFGSMVMAVSLPEPGERGLLFAGAYVMIQIGRSLFLVLAFRGHQRRPDAERILFWSVVSAVPWIVGAFARGTTRGALWALAITVDYTATSLGYPTPRLGRIRRPNGTIAGKYVSGEYLAERYQQFLIIALGQSIFAAGLAFSRGGYGGGRVGAFLVAFLVTVLMWRIYFYRAGQLLAGAIAVAPQPVRLSRSATHTHLVMVVGIVATSVGNELVIVHPLGPVDPVWIGVILGGPALFLAGRARFEYEVFGRVSRSRLIGLLVLAAVAPAMIFVPSLAVGVVAALVLAVIAGTDAARARGRPLEPPAPPVLSQP